MRVVVVYRFVRVQAGVGRFGAAVFVAVYTPEGEESGEVYMEQGLEQSHQKKERASRHRF